MLLAALLALATAAPSQAAQWQQIDVGNVQTPRNASGWPHSLVHDPVRNVFVHAGGLDRWTIHEFASGTWRQVATTWPYRPTLSVFDPNTGGILTIGIDDSTQSQHTLLWDGQNLTVLPATLPSTLLLGTPLGSTLVFDPVRVNVVLYVSNPAGNPASTWIWNGTGWASAGPAPASRFSFVSLDPLTSQVLLFTGNGSGMSAWVWSGTTWNVVTMPLPPEPWVTVAADFYRNRMIVLEGQTTLRAWEWDGTNWTLVAASTPAPASILQRHWYALSPLGNLMAASPTGLLVLGQWRDTWRYVPIPATQPAFTTLGQGCPGPAGIPSLRPVAGALPRLGETFTLELTNLPTTTTDAFGFLGDSGTAWNGIPLPIGLAALGMPGCTAWIAPQFMRSLQIQNGAATWRLPVPFSAAVAGTSFWIQGAATAPGWNAAGLVVTNAGRGTIGTP